jgi:hypothetical protein
VEFGVGGRHAYCHPPRTLSFPGGGPAGAPATAPPPPVPPSAWPSGPPPPPDWARPPEWLPSVYIAYRPQHWAPMVWDSTRVAARPQSRLGAQLTWRGLGSGLAPRAAPTG